LSVQEHTKVLVTLISFGTNLCYGKENFKFWELLKPNFDDISVELGYMLDVIQWVSEENFEEQAKDNKRNMKIESSRCMIFLYLNKL